MPDLSRERACRGKICYDGKANAEYIIRNTNVRASRGLGTRMEAYKCQWCAFWHLGHIAKNRKERATIRARRRAEGLEV